MLVLAISVAILGQLAQKYGAPGARVTDAMGCVERMKTFRYQSDCLWPQRPRHVIQGGRRCTEPGKGGLSSVVGRTGGATLPTGRRWVHVMASGEASCGTLISPSARMVALRRQVRAFRSCHFSGATPSRCESSYKNLIRQGTSLAIESRSTKG